MSDDSLTRLTFRNGEVTLSAVAAGPADGPVVLLLHGFPEFWYGWRKQIGPLAAAGFYLLVPDQRGYNESSKPQHVSDYSLRFLVSDVLCIIQQLGRKRVFLVGHDWGALVAWAVAAWYPEKLHRLVIINVPHPAVAASFLFTHPAQLLRSWYVFFFQIPRVPEMLFAAKNYQRGIQSLIRTSRQGTFSNDDLEQYRQAWKHPGALTGMINWYRALLRRPSFARLPEIEVPTLIIWGKQDAFLLPSLATASIRKCRKATLRYFDDATHWVHHEEPASVNSEILQFFVSS